MAIFNVTSYHVINLDTNGKDRGQVLCGYDTMFLFAWNRIHRVIVHIMVDYFIQIYTENKGAMR